MTMYMYMKAANPKLNMGNYLKGPKKVDNII